MEKKADVFFEIILRNAAAILREAHEQTAMQNYKLIMTKSKDRTADAAIDNICGGRMTLDANGEIIRLRNVKTWAQVIAAARKHYLENAEKNPKDKRARNLNEVFQIAYMEGMPNRMALKKVHMARNTFFMCKNEIKNFILAAACEIGLWRVMNEKK